MGNFYRYLTDDGLVGDGSNNDMAAVTTATDFYAGPPDGKVWDIERIIVFVEDGTATASLYGGITALTTGCGLKVRSGGKDGQIELDLLDGDPIKKNGDWAGVCYDLNMSSPGSGNSIVSVRWTLSKAGAPLRLVGGKDQKLVYEINDSMSGLVEHHISIQGREFIA